MRADFRLDSQSWYAFLQDCKISWSDTLQLLQLYLHGIITYSGTDEKFAEA